jgi:ABC-type Fe3+ transport system permease subunit
MIPPFRDSSAKARRYDIAVLLCLPLIILLALLLAYPVALLTWQSLRPASGPGIGSYLLLFTERPYRLALLHSVILSGIVAVLSTVVCLAPAWLFANERFPGKSIVRAFFTLPMSFSGIIVGFLAVIMLGRIGAVPQFFERLTGNAYTAGWAYQLSGLVLAYLYFEIPRATLTLESALKKFDPHLAIAARSLGAKRAAALSLHRAAADLAAARLYVRGHLHCLARIVRRRANSLEALLRAPAGDLSTDHRLRKSVAHGRDGSGADASGAGHQSCRAPARRRGSEGRVKRSGNSDRTAPHIGAAVSSRRARPTRLNFGLLAAHAITWALFIFVAAPVFVVIAGAFLDPTLLGVTSERWAGRDASAFLGLEWFRYVFDLYWRSIQFSLLLAGCRS